MNDTPADWVWVAVFLGSGLAAGAGVRRFPGESRVQAAVWWTGIGVAFAGALAACAIALL